MHYARVAELVDALVLGTSIHDVGVRVPPLVPLFERSEWLYPYIYSAEIGNLTMGLYGCSDYSEHLFFYSSEWRIQ